ncbi:MAG: DUF1501 domain-containing protein, partial [Verrucomicrobia bacterium]|nr:DUF1501 domain-containing protein [Verrucomicrobiota bacterium]
MIIQHAASADPVVSLRRRAFLGRSGLGLAALSSLLNRSSFATESIRSQRWTGVVNPFHHAPRAKRIIWLYMAGGPSHLETFDPKPELAKLHGQPMPESFTVGQQLAQLQEQKLKCFAPQFVFKRCGQNGTEISEIFPHISTVADELTVIRSMKTDAINHDPAHTLMNTGTMIQGRPSMGSWVLYGLGSECEDLPGFVVLTSTEGRSPQPISVRQWHSGFLPGQFQGVAMRSKGDPVLYLNRPPGVTADRQHDVVTAVQSLSRGQQQLDDDPELATRIAQYELAFKMQTAVPGLVDVANEP